MAHALISIAEARRRVLEAVRPRAPEPVPVAGALGRVLVEDVVAATDVPPFANSAMDGFAVAAGPAGRTLRVALESRAGHPAQAAVGQGEACRISTGAAMPEGADAVVPVEEASEHDGAVTLEVEATPGRHVRAAGEDLRAGETVLAAGTALGPGELGVLVGAGRGEVLCGPRPSVALLATGDELRAPGEPLGPGQIHESNLVTVGALATAAGARVALVRHVPDRRESIEEAIAEALGVADVVIASGGVSVGPHDHVKGALRELGVDEVFWGVALKPGKPTWFGTRDGTLVFGLPGNPVSAMVTFTLFARAALRALQGERPQQDELGYAQLAEPVRQTPSREQAVRVRLERRPDGLLAMITGPQESHQTRSMVGADALAIIPIGEGTLEAGTPVALAALL